LLEDDEEDGCSVEQIVTGGSGMKNIEDRLVVN